MNEGTLAHGDDSVLRGLVHYLPAAGAIVFVEDLHRYTVVSDLIHALRGGLVRNATLIYVAPDLDAEIKIRALAPSVRAFYDPPLFEKRMTFPPVPPEVARMRAHRLPPSPRTGWECPRCRAILAPHVDRCTCTILHSSGPTATC